jgi:hypothetical protein
MELDATSEEEFKGFLERREKSCLDTRKKNQQ